MFALELQEDLNIGSCTQLEYILISQTVKHLKIKGIDPELDTIHAVYLSCTELSHALELSLPLGPESKNDLDIVLKEYNRNIKIFEATCVTQLKINFTSTK